MSQPPPPFAELLAQCSTSAMHLETRDAYAIGEEDQDLTAWRAGVLAAVEDRASWWGPFHDAVAEAVSRGVIVQRARVVSLPPTEYVRFEHACTPRNLAAGEEVRWLRRDQALGLLLPAHDFWIFDDKLVRWHHFGGNGAHLRDEVDECPVSAERAGRAFAAVWSRAVPHGEFILG
ncbi:MULTISPECIES: DUF6879 family protein [unclassified Streptomyces]|uniref:DUF6879 family protein n=1 Tax=unclassified Streptomyces TaxID=2593676 RepID=UPI000B811960|nr:DUF6879 family protein [Streptomyces sp. MnatMP-M77]MYT76563.1 hypothetical protein [Streptomyces sp. SID8364]